MDSEGNIFDIINANSCETLKHNLNRKSKKKRRVKNGNDNYQNPEGHKYRI